MAAAWQEINLYIKVYCQKTKERFFRILHICFNSEYFIISVFRVFAFGMTIK